MNKHQLRLGYFTHSKCNLSCDGCNSLSNHSVLHDQKPNSYQDSMHKDLDIILERFGIESWAFTGGETLFRSDVWQRVRHVCNTVPPETKVFLFTNGLLIDEEHISNMIDIADKYPNVLIMISYHHDPAPKNKYNHMMQKVLQKVFRIVQAEEKSQEEIRDLLLDSISHGYASDPTDYSRGFVRVECPNQNILINVFPIVNWQYGEILDNGMPKQYKNDYKEAHAACMCPNPFYDGDGQIFKCPYMHQLKKLLIKKGHLEDWPLLRDYEPYDLYAEHNHEKMTTMLGPEEICSYCTVNACNDKTDKQTKLIRIIE